jgi:hypothetical protein
MNFVEAIEAVKRMDGNYFKNSRDMYILPSNMIKLAELLEDTDDLQDILITPFLIGEKATYELHYYEFMLEFRDIPISCFVEYNKNNKLPQEILNNIKPAAHVCNGDRAFYLTALYDYLIAMQNMQFEFEMQFDHLKNLSLYYMIY